MQYIYYKSHIFNLQNNRLDYLWTYHTEN